MKRALSGFCLAVALLFAALPARADVMDPSAPSYSGVFMFVYQGNDNHKGLTAMLTMINDWFRNEMNYEGDYLHSLEILDKFDDSSGSAGIVDLAFTSPKGGTWTSTTPIEFYAVKGGGQVAIYWLENGADSGLWSTGHLFNGGGDNPDLSHLSVYNPFGMFHTIPTPEPASLLLVGGGLLGLALLRRSARRRTSAG